MSFISRVTIVNESSYPLYVRTDLSGIQANDANELEIPMKMRVNVTFSSPHYKQNLFRIRVAAGNPNNDCITLAVKNGGEFHIDTFVPTHQGFDPNIAPPTSAVRPKVVPLRD